MELSILTKDFLFHCSVERGLGALTVDSYRHDLKQFSNFCGPRVTAAKALRTDNLKRFLEDMTRRRKLSPNTVRRRLACLKSLAKFAYERHAILNPFNDWSPRIRTAKTLPKALARSDIAKLVCPNSTFHDEEVAFALLVFGATGLRISELCGLTVRDVSERGDVIRVVGKGAKDRIVYLTHSKLMSQMRARRRERYVSGGESMPIFINFRGKAMRPQTLRRRLHAYTKQLGYGHRVTPHMFRHTAATLLIEQGADIRFVQKLLGHASISTTEIYTHVSNEALRSAIQKADTFGSFLDP